MNKFNIPGFCPDMRYNVIKSPRAFTLLEVMIALAITGSLVTVVYTLNHHLDIADRHETVTKTMMLGMEKLSEIRKAPAETEGEFPEPYSGYRYKVRVVKSSYPGIEEISVTVTGDKEKVVLKELFRSDIRHD